MSGQVNSVSAQLFFQTRSAIVLAQLPQDSCFLSQLLQLDVNSVSAQVLSQLSCLSTAASAQPLSQLKCLSTAVFSAQLSQHSQPSTVNPAQPSQHSHLSTAVLAQLLSQVSYLSTANVSSDSAQYQT